MLKWLSNTLEAWLTRFINREMTKLVEVGDYDAVLQHATTMCQKRANNATALYWRATALIWLERFQEVLDIANGVETLQAEGVLKLTDEWIIVFEKFKCHALNGLEQYDALYEFASKCLERHPGTVSLASFQLIASMHLRKLTASTSCLQFLDGSVNNFDQAWHFLALYEAQRHLRNKDRAREIAKLALAKYPDSPRVREIAKENHTSRRTCDVRASHRRPIK